MEMRRLIILTISFSSLIFPAIVAGNHPTSHHLDNDDDACAEQQCSPNGPAVRFPFVLLGKQPEYCGYNSSYNLHCDELKRTILELPSSSIKLEVTSILYSYQRMIIQPLETCFAKQLRDFDISTTPFHNSMLNEFVSYAPVQYSLFNCSSSTERRSYPWVTNIDCLRNGEYEVYAVYRESEIRYMADDLESCTKMYDTNWVPYRLFDLISMDLIWFLPLCQSCEARGGICGWQNRTSNEIGCLGGHKHHSSILKILRISGPIIGCFLLVLAIAAINLVCDKLKQRKKDEKIIRKFLEDYSAMKPTRYSFADIKKITNDFKNKLGEGGYGNVFKGQISNKIFVAVKLLHSSAGNGEEFINEVGTMGTIHHVNVVRLLGFCADGYNRALVYEFLPNGSLDKFIFSDDLTRHKLGMERLRDIAIGIARGIEYLHQGCQQRILHFDIKPHNILLDENYNPKISDFGLAKLCEKGRSAVSMTAARGTMGYIAPEVFSRHFGNVSYKSDIYSFGMLLLEMVGKRKNIDSTVQNVSQVYFPEWAYGRLVNGEELAIEVEEDKENQIAKNLAIIGLRCIQWNPMDRPSITFVLQMLEGSGENLNLPPNPFTSGIPFNSPDSNEDEKSLLGSTLYVISESE